MTQIARLLGFCFVFLLISCADGTEQSPIGPSSAPTPTLTVADAIGSGAHALNGLEANNADPDSTPADKFMKTYSVSGTVKDSRGAVKGAYVTVSCPGGFTSKRFTTDARGHYTVTGVPAGKNCKVTVEIASHDIKWLPTNVPAANPVNFTLTRKTVSNCEAAYQKAKKICDKLESVLAWNTCMDLAKCKRWVCGGGNWMDYVSGCKKNPYP